MMRILRLIKGKSLRALLGSFLIPLTGLSFTALSFSGAPKAGSWPRPVEKKTVNRQVQTASEADPCREDAIRPNVQLQLISGQVYRYETIKAEITQSAPSGMKNASGQIVVRGEPIPFKQTIKIGGYSEYGGERCLSVEREGILEDPASKDRSRSWMNSEGRIRYCESETTVTEGQNTNVNTNTMSDIAASSDLHYFYGYWMLALTPEFSWECLKTTPEGQLFKKLKVRGMEQIGGRECFIVERTTRTEAGETDTTMYWVDKDKRIAVQVKKGGYLIRLIS